MAGACAPQFDGDSVADIDSKEENDVGPNSLWKKPLCVGPSGWEAYPA